MTSVDGPEAGPGRAKSSGAPDGGAPAPHEGAGLRPEDEWPPDIGPDSDASATPSAGVHSDGTPTRASGAWTAAVGAVVLLLLLAVFVGQNARSAPISFLFWHGHAPTAVLLLVAAVVGGTLVAAAGIARILQLRRRRARTDDAVGG